MKPLLLLLALYALTASAVPAKRERYTLKLHDGSTIEATLTGNEALHYYLTDDGKYLQCDNKGIAHFVEPDILEQRWQAKIERRKSVKKRFANKPRSASRVPMTGSKRGLVILVQFPQTAFHYTYSDFQSLFNEEGYTDDINIGSVHDYFLEQSYGMFDFSFDIVGPVTMSRPLSYYGSNNDLGDDIYPATMVTEALQMIDDEVDFSQYDWDEDGQVEQIFFIHSGYDEAQSGRATDIWSHAWTLTEALEEGDGNGPVVMDGVLIDSYATSAELRDKTGLGFTGIGTACHEFSHCFGLPDVYDTVGRNFGMNTWSLMDYGCYNGDGGTPCGFTSYERFFCGWLEPIELDNPMIIEDMPALTSEPIAYIFRNSGKSDEYFLFENRQKERWDKYLGGHGMLILHVDYDETAWKENTVNAVRAHKRLTIIPADNIPTAGTTAGDTWPGTTGKTEFSDTSSPAAVFYNPNAEGDKLIHHFIYYISESEGGLVSYIFDDEEMGINGPEPSRKKEEIICNLAGQVVLPNYRGIIITRDSDGNTRLKTTKR